MAVEGWLGHKVAVPSKVTMASCLANATNKRLMTNCTRLSLAGKLINLINMASFMVGWYHKCMLWTKGGCQDWRVNPPPRWKIVCSLSRCWCWLFTASIWVLGKYHTSLKTWPTSLENLQNYHAGRFTYFFKWRWTIAEDSEVGNDWNSCVHL